MKILPSVCPLDCPDTCSLQVTTDHDKVVDVRGSNANPYTGGVICAKVVKSYPEMIHGNIRLTSPLKRCGNRGSREYVRITWDEALDLVYLGFSRVIDKFGAQSVIPLNYAGPHGELACGSMDRRFFHRLGASLLSRGPLCGQVRGSSYESLFGTAPGMPPQQAEHSDLIVIWGNNVTVSNLHLARVLQSARKRGARVVVIDPKRIKIAEQATLHLQIHPGTDVVLAMATAAELERRNSLDMNFIQEWTTGFDQYMEEARQYTTAIVESKCGLSIEEFHQFVSLISEAENVATSIGNGIERGYSGGSGLRAAMALQALTGNHGRLGAGVIAKQGFAFPRTSGRLQQTQLVPIGTRTINIREISAKLLDEDLDPPIKAIMIYNHNPVCTHPDQVRLIKALQQEDLFIVGSDIVMTDSMAFADVILPAASHFEYADIYASYGHTFLQRAAPVIPLVGEALPNTEIFRLLASRFGFKDSIFQQTDEELMDAAMEENSPLLKGYRPSSIPLNQAIVMNSAEGEDLIMCKTVKPSTSSGKIELYSENLQDKFGFGVPRFRDIEKKHPFTLISPSSAKRTNATFGGCSDSRGYELVEMNPLDADQQGLSDGEIILLWNELGSVTLKLKISDAVKPGVLYSSKGTWLNSSDTGLTVNALIPSNLPTDIEGGTCFNETFVDVQPA